MANSERIALIAAVAIGTSAITYIVTTAGNENEQSNDFNHQPLTLQAPTSPSAEELRQAEEDRLAEIARQERAEHEKLVYEYAEQSYKGIVKSAYSCGKNITYDLEDWEHIKFKEEYKITLSLNWNGCVLGGDYEAIGLMRVQDGQVTWQPDWHNSRLDEFVKNRRWAKIGAGVVVVAGATVAASKAKKVEE